MVSFLRLNTWVRKLLWIAGFIAALLFVLFANTPVGTRAENERVITVYYDGIEKTIVTDAQTVAEALERAQVTLHDFDTVEPAADTQLVAPSYNVNVYRARPVTVVDGYQRYTVMTSHTSAREIVQAAGLELFAEDTYSLTRIDDIVREGGVGLKLTIDRATPVTLVLYGKRADIRTQASTVGDLLAEKQVVMSDQDGTNVSPATPITPGIEVQVWRDGVQTLTDEQEVAFSTKQIRDTSKPVGFKEI